LGINQKLKMKFNRERKEFNRNRRLQIAIWWLVVEANFRRDLTLGSQKELKKIFFLALVAGFY